MKQTSGPFEVLRFYDPAIDWPDDDGGKAAVEYAQFRDMSKLRFVDEAVARPMVFVCRRLSVAQRKAMTSASDEAEQNRRSFLYGVIEVRNYSDDGVSYLTWTPKRADESSRIDEDELERFGEADVQEIGSVIRGQSFLAKGLRLRLLPLASSQDAYLTVRFLSAERKKAAVMETASQ